LATPLLVVVVVSVVTDGLTTEFGVNIVDVDVFGSMTRGQQQFQFVSELEQHLIRSSNIRREAGAFHLHTAYAIYSLWTGASNLIHLQTPQSLHHYELHYQGSPIFRFITIIFYQNNRN